jgi:hypothetical protein
LASAAACLIELLIASSAMIFVAIAIGRFANSDGSSSLRLSRTLGANSIAQEFFQLRKKHFTNYATAPVFNLKADAAGTIFSGATLSYTNLSNAGGGVETFNTNCKSLPANIRPLPQADLDEINNCLSATCGNNQIPVLRDAGGTQVFPQGAGDGRDGNPLGAALCFKLDGLFKINPDGSITSNYKTASMRLITLVTLPGNQGVLLQRLEAVLPAPKVDQPDSITIKAVLPSSN